MGYRSQVALGLCTEADQLLKANAEMIPELAELIKDNESVNESYGEAIIANIIGFNIKFLKN